MTGTEPDKQTMAEGMGEALSETPAAEGAHTGKGGPDLARGMSESGGASSHTQPTSGAKGARSEADIARGMDEAGKR